MSDDVVAHVEQELEQARAAAAAAFDRVDALTRLRSLIYGFAAESNARILAPQQLWAHAQTPEAEAELQSLVDRALPATTSTDGELPV